MVNFEPNAILRGAQLTVVGAHRALLNPAMFKNHHYKQAVIAVAVGILIQLILSIPVLLIRGSIAFSSIFINLERATWDDMIIDTLNFLQHSVLQVPFFLMTLFKYADPALDNMFMESLDWVDRTYLRKHESDDPTRLRAIYYPNLRLYDNDTHPVSRNKRQAYIHGMTAYMLRFLRKGGLALSIYLVSYVPYLGKFVLPAVSFYAFNKVVGPQPAVVIFASGLFVPKRWLVIFLQSFFASRSLMRELLEPYLGRIGYNREQRREWFFDREGVLFGFGIAFFFMIKIPYIGVLAYGIAEASTAYLITKIVDPPPPPMERAKYMASQLKWKNKKKFLSMPLHTLDANNADTSEPQPFASGGKRAAELPNKKFT